MTQNSPTLIITLTDRRPITIKKAEWPIVASGAAKASGEEGTCKLFVRQRGHARGSGKESIVYGIQAWDGGERAGYLIDDERDDDGNDNVVRAIHRVAEKLDFENRAPSIVQECLAELPPEEL